MSTASRYATFIAGRSACHHRTPPSASMSRARRTGSVRDQGSAAMRLEPPARLVQVAALLPEPPHREREVDRASGVAGRDRAVKHGPQVVVLALELLQEPALVGTGQAGGDRLRERQVPAGVAAPDRRRVVAGVEHLRRELADRLEHLEPRLGRRPGAGSGSGRRATSARRGRPSRSRTTGRRSPRPPRGRSRRRRRTADRAGGGAGRRGCRSSRRSRRGASAGGPAGRGRRPRGG